MTGATVHDEGFWQAAYESHGPAVLGFLRRRLPERAEAEDLLQETFVRAMRLGSFQEGGNLRGYLLTIARNLLVNRSRRPKLVVPVEPAVEGEQEFASVPAPTASPEREATVNLFRSRLDRLLESMKTDHRRAFEMAVIEQRSYGEVAELTGWSLPRVKTNVFRARRRIIDELGQFLPAE